MKALLLAVTLGLMAGSALAKQPIPPTSPAVAAKVALRGDPYEVRVAEMRIVRKNDILTVQADLENTNRANRTVFYRFRWLDDMGNQVGDGEAWKQMSLYGLQLQTVKSVAPTSAVTDLKLEMNVEPK